MKFFLDTANTGEIKTAVEWGVLDGVTTNPTLIAKEGGDLVRRIREIASIVPGPVNAEVLATRADEMVREGREYAKLAKNVSVKVPMTKDGLKACRILSTENIPVNVTLVFSANQALLAAKSGAAYVSPFIGRLDDRGQDGMQLIRDIVQIYGNYDFQTEVLTASVRHPIHVLDAAKAGADIATMPFKVLELLFTHPLTDIGLKQFMDDWEKVKKA
ncbi:MAG: fructose-6-phosphate aldolase [Methanobacteriota archaeon]